MKFHPKLKAVALKKLQYDSFLKLWVCEVTWHEKQFLEQAGLRVADPIHNCYDPWELLIGRSTPGGTRSYRFFASEKVHQKILRWKKDIEQAEATRRANYQALAHRRSRSEKQGGSVD